MTRFRTAAAILGAALAASTLVGAPQEPSQRKTQGSPQRQVATPTGEALPAATGTPVGETPPALVEDASGALKSAISTVDQTTPLQPLIRLVSEIRKDYSVEAYLAPDSRGQPTIVVHGNPMHVNDAMKAIGAAFRDEARWASTKAVQRDVYLSPVAGESSMTVDEVRSILRQVESNGLEASMRWNPHGPLSDRAICIRLSGKNELVDAAAERIAEIAADRDRWLEADRHALEKSTVTLDFPGGTVEEFLQAVIGKFNFVPPIYQDESYRKLSMRPVKSRLTDIPAALNLLTRVPPLDANGSPVPLKATFDDGSRNTWASLNLHDLNERLFRSVMVIDRAGGTKSASVQIRRAAFTLGEEAPKREVVDTMLDAISVAISLDGPSQNFRAKFHAPSNILILQGTPDELAVAGQIVRGKFPKSLVEVPTVADQPAPASAETAPVRQ